MSASVTPVSAVYSFVCEYCDKEHEPQLSSAGVISGICPNEYENRVQQALGTRPMYALTSKFNLDEFLRSIGFSVPTKNTGRRKIPHMILSNDLHWQFDDSRPQYPSFQYEAKYQNDTPPEQSNDEDNYFFSELGQYSKYEVYNGNEHWSDSSSENWSDVDDLIVDYISTVTDEYSGQEDFGEHNLDHQSHRHSESSSENKKASKSRDATMEKRSYADRPRQLGRKPRRELDLNMKEHEEYSE